jgi:hypothetical protein
MLHYTELLSSFKKGFRNGNWKKLNRAEKALYRVSLWYARVKGRIVNQKLVELLLGILERLLETLGMRMLKRGIERATEMLEKYEQSGVFKWAPQLKKWLRHPDYITWLGTFSRWG